MKNKINKNLKALSITLAIVIIISVCCFADNSFVLSAINGITKGAMQVSAAATASADTASYDDLKTENEELKSENAKLRQQLADYYDLKTENERLWKYYDLKKANPSYDVLPAKVIRRSSLDDFYSFTLDQGSADGVEINDPVITENGLVGRVGQVDAATCKVTTILSPDTKAGAVDKQSGDSGIVSGAADLSDRGLTRFDKLAENNSVKVGDMLVTDGTGGVYPENLIIGKVKELGFNTYDTSRYAVVQTYEDISRISAAAIITDFDGKGKVGDKK